MSSLKKKIIDVRGLSCPGPTEVLNGIIKYLEDGTIVELLADDPDVKVHVSEWCKKTGNSLLSINEKDETLTILIKIKK